MYATELLKDLLITIQCLQKELTGSDAEKVKIAQEAYQELLDGFYEEHQDMMIRQQYEAAKHDPDYFLVLIQLAYHYQNQAIVHSDEEPSLPYTNLGGHYGKQFSHHVQSDHKGNRGRRHRTICKEIFR